MDDAEKQQTLDAIQQQLDRLDTTEYFLIYGIMATFLRYHLIQTQKDTLQKSMETDTPSTDLPDMVQLEVVSALLGVYSLCGFFSQTESIYNELTPDTEQFASVQQDLVLSATIILVAIVRFFKLLEQRFPPEEGLTPNEEALEIAP